MVGGARSETKDKRVTQSHTISSIINTSGTPGGGGGGNHLSCKTQIQKYKIQNTSIQNTNTKNTVSTQNTNAKIQNTKNTVSMQNTKYQKYSLNQ